MWYPILVALLLSSYSYQLLAHQPERGKLLAATGPFVYRTPTPPGEAEGRSPYLGAFGLVVNGGINNVGELEVSLFAMRKHYFRRVDDSYFNESRPRIHMSSGYRHWFNPSLSLALTIGSAYAVGDVSSPLTGNEGRSLAEDTVVYAIDSSLLVMLARWGDYYVNADVRYSMTLPLQPDRASDHYGLMIALQYHLPKPIRRD